MLHCTGRTRRGGNILAGITLAIGLSTGAIIAHADDAPKTPSNAELPAQATSGAPASETTASPANTDDTSSFDNLLKEVTQSAPVSETPAVDTSVPDSAPTSDPGAPEVAPPAPVAEAPTTETVIPVAEPTAARRNNAQLEEIIVTATKREESLRDIPASIASISGEELAQRNAQGTQDIVKLVPGVNYSSDSVTPGHITIRGISASPGTGFTAGVLFGDVSFVDQFIPISSLDPNTFDLKSVDVLKGPQGTLFGASALNGAIRYVPNQPVFGQWQGSYYLDYSRYVDSSWKPNVGGVVNVPIGDTFALRVMGFERQAPGWINNIRTGVKAANSTSQGGVRAVAGWKPADELDVKLSFAWQNTHVADTSVATDENLNNNVSPRASPQRVNYRLLDLNASYDLGFAHLVSETAQVHKGSNLYSDSSNRLEGFAPSVIPDGSIPLLAVVAGGYSDTVSQELRLVSNEDNDSPWKWVAGAFASRQHVVTTADLPIGDSSIPISSLISVINQFFPQLTGGEAENGVINGEHSYVEANVRETALFVDVTRRLLDDLELTLGGRLYSTKSAGSGYTYGPLILLGNQQVQVNRAAEVGEKGINPKASLAWRIAPDVMAYAAAAKGFRVGGIQSGSALPTETQPPPVFQSDSIWNYETGLRSEWFDHTLRSDITFFYERWNHPQYMEFGASGLTSFTTNVGGVKSEGVEASLQMLLPLPGLLFSVSGSYSNTVTTEPFATSNGSIAPVGSPWPFAPHWQTATTLAYIRDIGSWNVNGSLTHSFLGKAVNNLQQQSPIFGYQQWDASVSVDNQSHPWIPELTLTVNNFMDERGLVNHNFMTSPNPYNDLTYIPPRRITLRVSGHF